MICSLGGEFMVYPKDQMCPKCGKLFSIKGIGSHIWRMHGEGRYHEFAPRKLSSTSWSKGLTKETDVRIAKMSLSLKKIKPQWQISVDDDGKLKQRYVNKRVNSKSEGIEFHLTFYEYCKLVADAGLVSSDLGFTGKGYVLARFNDEGGYEFSNCRFITQLENARERESHTVHKRVECIEDRLEFKSITDCARNYGITYESIMHYINNHNGFIPKINKTFKLL